MKNNSFKNSRLIDELGVAPIIAAGGPNTKHSGTRPRSEVVQMMEEMSEVFVQMDEWLLAAGKEIAKLTGAEAATITSGASGGLVLQSAAAIARDDVEVISQLPITKNIPNELIIQRAHRFAYDNLYLIPGAKFVEVGTDTGCESKDIENAITSRSVGVIHLASPGANDNAVSIEVSAKIAHKHKLPLLCDAASMLPPRKNLKVFLDAGADLVSFSGGKGVRGPQSTGFLLGTKQWVEYARLNNAPNATIARSQKVSKEEIGGLIAALRVFVSQNEEEETRRYKSDMQTIVDRVIEIPGIKAAVIHNEQYYIPHAVIELTNEWRGPSGHELGRLMLETSPRIYIRSAYEDGKKIAIDPLNIQEGELDIVASKLNQLLINSIN